MRKVRSDCRASLAELCAPLQLLDSRDGLASPPRALHPPGSPGGPGGSPIKRMIDAPIDPNMVKRPALRDESGNTVHRISFIAC